MLVKITKKKLAQLISEMMSIPNVKYIDDPDELNLQVAMKIKDLMSPDQALAMSEPQLRDMAIGIYEKHFDPDGEGWDPHDEDLEAIESHLTIIPLPDDPDFDPEEHGHHYEEHPTYDSAGKQDGVDYSFKKEGNMRLKESQLRKIIREELQLEFFGMFGGDSPLSEFPTFSDGKVNKRKLTPEQKKIYDKGYELGYKNEKMPTAPSALLKKSYEEGRIAMSHASV